MDYVYMANLPEKKNIPTAYIEAINWQAVLCLGKALPVASNSGGVSPHFHPMKESDRIYSNVYFARTV